MSKVQTSRFDKNAWSRARSGQPGHISKKFIDGSADLQKKWRICEVNVGMWVRVRVVSTLWTDGGVIFTSHYKMETVVFRPPHSQGLLFFVCATSHISLLCRLTGSASCTTTPPKCLHGLLFSLLVSFFLNYSFLYVFCLFTHFCLVSG